MTYLLAVDGGNTKTIALVADHHGRLLGQGWSGKSDIYGVASPGIAMVEEALTNIEMAVQQALEAACLHRTELTASVFSLAGADWPEDYAFLQAALHARRLGQHILVQNDAFGILPAVSPENVGVTVVCGTGAATGARGYDGRSWHSSFWQLAQGSDHLRQQAIAALLRAELGLDEPTSLTQRVLHLFGCQTIEEVLHALTARQPTPEGTMRGKKMATLLLDEAETGDGVARRTIQQHGHALGDYAAVAVRRVGLEQEVFPLILAGGIFSHPGDLLAETLVERVRQTAPRAQLQRTRLEPILGVLLAAFYFAGIAVDSALHEQIVGIPLKGSLFQRQHGFSAQCGGDETKTEC